MVWQSVTTHGEVAGDLSRKAGLRLGKDSTGVEEYPNQDKLHKISVLRWDLNPGLPDGRPRC
jgi:hypothetical protein